MFDAWLGEKLIFKELKIFVPNEYIRRAHPKDSQSLNEFKLFSFISWIDKIALSVCNLVMFSLLTLTETQRYEERGRWKSLKWSCWNAWRAWDYVEKFWWNPDEFIWSSHDRFTEKV